MRRTTVAEPACGREASNLFVMGGAAFPQNPGHNPTCTIGALTYWSAQAITSRYLKSPGPLA